MDTHPVAYVAVAGLLILAILLLALDNWWER